MSPSVVKNERVNPRVAIVGGGIGGLCLAIGLHNHNVEFHIYEAAPEFSEIGAGVGLAPNAQRAMSLIDPRIRAGYDRHATLNLYDEKKDYFFEFRMGMDGKPDAKIAGMKSGDLLSRPGGIGKGMSMIHRARFVEELAALIPPSKTSFGKRLEKIVQTVEGVNMYFCDGTVAEADVVIGCDGVKSRVRQSLFGNKYDAVFSGKYAYRGLLPMQKAIDTLGESRAGNSQAYLGYGGHVLTMQVDKGNTMNVVAFRTKTDRIWEDSRWVLPVGRPGLRKDFEGWSPEVHSILGLMEEPDLWALFDHPPLESLWKDRVCLLGDAAHATTPHQGSGAAMAIEDAYILSELMGMAKNIGNLEAIFRAYDAVRLDRTMKLVQTSRECGEVYDFLDPEIQDDAAALHKNLTTRFNWIWDEDVEGQWAKARAVFMSSK
ncbi:hypothetical protein AAFC00_001621 [Neodothiora populina]|uniref:FAD-binding domain-containing protein n=1 Tax=Neodothiora populina TaxID=2781224 RepID=A0ABR3PPV7_9PEZI